MAIEPNIGHNRENTRKIFLLSALAYAISYGLYFAFLNTYFWDDYLNYFDKTSIEVRKNQGAFSGFSPVRLLAEGWIAENSPEIFRVMIFFAFPIATYALWTVLGSINYLNEREKIVITVLFLLLPSNSARVAMTMFMYSTCNAAFFVGWWCYTLKRRWWTIGLSILFFLYSFDTASFLVFMIIPISVSFFETYNRGISVIRWFRQNIIFVVLPLLYWFIEPIFNPTLDPVRAAYYSPSISGTLRAIALGLILGLISLYLVAIRKWRAVSHRGGIQIVLGAIMTWIGMFPYLALGHFPNINSWMLPFVPGESDWDSRHQLLLPLGISVLVLGLINVANPNSLIKSLGFLVMVFTIFNFTFTQEYYLDSIKSVRIVEAIKSDPDFTKLKSVIIDDQALRFNARGRGVRSYEWELLMKQANPQLSQKADVYRYVDCESLRPDSIVTVTAGSGKLKTLITRNPEISLRISPVEICD